MDIDPQMYTAVQLRDWLRALGQRASGTKNEMALRLSAIAPEERGNAPPEIGESDEEVNGGDEIDVVIGDDASVPIERSSGQGTSRASAGNLSGEEEAAYYRREMALIQRERDLLLRENAFLKNRSSGTTRSLESEQVPLNVVKEMVPEFDGGSNFDFWTTQIRSVSETYNLNENLIRVLITTKLTGKAQKWLHNNINVATCSVNELLNLMKNVFGNKENKLVLRRRFEERKWACNESFMDYCNEKTSMATNLHIDEEEMVDYLIEGIPDHQLRTQAFLQCFTTKLQLTKAFAKVTLPNNKGRDQGRTFDKREPRCYNCNAIGHYASACPKRGACYGCGQMDHQVKNCPERKKAAMMVEEIDYVRIFKYVFENNFNKFVCLDTLIDSGSPISFARRSSLPKNITLNLNVKNQPNYFGINKSKLSCYGKISCAVLFENNRVDLNLLIVADESMSYDVVLGRDFLYKSGSKIILGHNNNGKVYSYSHKNRNFKKFENNNNTKCEVQNSKVNKTDENVKLNYENINKNLENGGKAEMIENNENLNDSARVFDQMLNICHIQDNEVDLVLGDVTFKEKKKLLEMFDQLYIQPERPREAHVKCEMKISVNDTKPFNYPPRRISYTEKKELQKILDEYIDKGFIRPSDSEYASPIVLVKKKSGELRMCVDFRKLNKVTVRDNYPLPHIDDLLDSLSGKKVFTKLDLKNGFYHVRMSPESVKFTAFITPSGQFEYLVMPFGLRNSPPTFQRFINKVFADLIRENKVIIYMDDILIASGSVEEHMLVLEEVFKRLVENKLQLRLDKCEFLQQKIKYLGYTITSDGIKADEKGLEAINNFPVPTNVKSVQTFLGLCSYFRRFVKNFSILAKPLYDLTRKNVVFKFGPEELKCFELLKSKLVEAPILSIYNPIHETELHCDASSLGFGAILLQKKEDKKLHPVFYFSKRTTDTESKYHSFELETLAIIYALKRFRIYLLGRTFKIVTDCNSLKLTLDKQELNPRIARWALELENYDYKLEHRKNEQMRHADALSRCIMVVNSNTFEENLIICQAKDKKIKKLQKELEKSESKIYEMKNGVVYKKAGADSILFYVPENMEKQVIFKFHDEMGHVGIDKVVDLIRKSYWFPNVREKVSDHIKNCLKCIVFSSKPGREEGFLHVIPKGENPFDVIHIDHYGPIDGAVKSKKHILVVVDACTKFVRLYCTKTTKTQEVINALADYFRAYSRPKVLVSDRGSAFTSSEFKDFLCKNNVRHIKIATGSPQANGQVERINRSLGSMLAKLIDREAGKPWTSVVEAVEFSLNNTIHRAIGTHPSIMLFGENQRGLASDLLQEKLTEKSKKKKVSIKRVRAKAAMKQTRLQIYNKKYVDKKRRKPTLYKTGDYVMIKNFDSHVGAAKKLIPKFKGPYKVEKILRNDRYLLKDVEGFQQSQIPYTGVWAVGNIRPWINEQARK